MGQRKGESLDDFVNRAKLQAQKCDFSADEINNRLLELVIAETADLCVCVCVCSWASDKRRGAGGWVSYVYMLHILWES